MNKSEIIETVNAMTVAPADFEDDDTRYVELFDGDQYVIRAAGTFCSVNQNGEEVICNSAERAAEIIIENAK